MARTTQREGGLEDITAGAVPGMVHPTQELEQLASKSRVRRRPRPPILPEMIEVALRSALAQFGTIAKNPLAIFPTSEFASWIGKGERYSLPHRTRLPPSVRACGKGAARPPRTFLINLRVTQLGPT